MASRSHTGGEKEFVYSKEDTKRIQSEDTESTAAFKKVLGAYAEQRFEERKMMRESRTLRRTLILAGAGLLIVIAIVFFLLAKR